MKLHVVDGTYELFRAHYSRQPDRWARAGWNAKATIGVVSSLLALLHDPSEAVTHLAVAFDNPIRSFRNDLFPGYKDDEGVPPELRNQFDAVEDAVRALGVVVWSMREYEADDALATASVRYADSADQVRVLTPDKDLAQCLRDDRVVQVDRRQKKVVDEATFRAVKGISPEHVPDFLALMGDVADGIPGLDGFGEKSAASLVGAYGRLENIPNDASAWCVKIRGAPALAATLRAQRDRAVLYRELATLVTSVPLAESVADLQFLGVPQSSFEKWCDEVNAQTLRTAPKRWR